MKKEKGFTMAKGKWFCFVWLFLVFSFMNGLTAQATSTDTDAVTSAVVTSTVSTTDADFYLVDYSSNGTVLSYEAIKNLTYVGSGKIQSAKSYIDQPKQVSAMLVEVPDCSAYMKDYEQIRWRNSLYYNGNWIIVGEAVRVIELDHTSILSAKPSDYPADTILKWDSFEQNAKDVADGTIPVEWLEDPVYGAMNLPSETKSNYMKANNAHIVATMTDLQTTGVAIGMLYPTSGVELPEKFTVCLGNIKLFAFSKSKNDWVIVQEQEYPTGININTLPWASSTTQKCEQVRYYSDHVEVSLTKEQLDGNMLHFWGKRTEIDREDYLYYASAYEFWIKEKDANDILTATVGMDAKDADGGNIVQLFSGRGLAITNEKRVHWGHTIPNIMYNPIRDGEKLQQLMREEDAVVLMMDTAEDMIATPLPAGSVVLTKGYHTVDDGGAGIYQIKNDSTLKADGATKIALENGLIAQLHIINNSIFVEQCGAYGDGQHDDVVAIQTAFDSGYTVRFSKNKTYKIISNGLSIRKNLTLDGNGSTILIDGSYNPTDVDSFGKKVIRTSMQPIDTVLFQNVNIEVDMPDNRYESKDYLSVFHPTFIDSVSLKSVNITVGSSYNSITNFWMDHGCQSLSLENCTFTNNTTHKEGGIIFLNSANDKIHGRYHAFDSIVMNNCNFNGTCGDEAIAIWGENDVNATISNTVVNWDRVAGGSSRPVNISSSVDCGTIFDVTFRGCEFICSGIEENNNSECDSFIGIGTKYASNKIKVAFDSCDITANVRDAFIKPVQLINEPEQIVNFDFLNPNIDLEFRGCNIVCDRPITGCNKIVCPTTNVSTWPSDCSFENCTIQSKYVFAFLEYYTTTKVFYTPRISVSNSEICIDEPLAFIYRTNLGAKCDLDLRNVNIKAESVNDIYTFRYNSNLTPEMTQKNADKITEYIENVKINGVLKK